MEGKYYIRARGIGRPRLPAGTIVFPIITESRLTPGREIEIAEVYNRDDAKLIVESLNRGKEIEARLRSIIEASKTETIFGDSPRRYAIDKAIEDAVSLMNYYDKEPIK